MNDNELMRQGSRVQKLDAVLKHARQVVFDYNQGSDASIAELEKALKEFDATTPQVVPARSHYASPNLRPNAFFGMNPEYLELTAEEEQIVQEMGGEENI